MTAGIQGLGPVQSRSLFRVAGEKKYEPLRECVNLALKRYLEHLDGHPAGGIYEMVLNEVEPHMLKSVMDYCGGNQTRAAEMLGMSRSTLRKKLNQYGLTT